MIRFIRSKNLSRIPKWFPVSAINYRSSYPSWLTAIMKITKNIGMLLLAVYLIIDGLLGFGLNLGPAIFLLYLVALAAGIFILIGK
jgi:hypothetical protein